MNGSDREVTENSVGLDASDVGFGRLEMLEGDDNTEEDFDYFKIYSVVNKIKLKNSRLERIYETTV